MRILIISILLIIVNTSCYYDKLEEITPLNTLNTCDTTSTITYTGKIETILSGCTVCHGANGGSGGVSLSNYASVKSVAQSGKLYGSVAWDGTAANMPQGGNKIPDCDIQLIKKWISTNYTQ